MSYQLERSKEEIDRVLGWVDEGLCSAEGTRFSGMSYERGIKTTLLWILGEEDEAPDAE